MSGINTLLQTLIGSRLPIVMGASFAYTLPLLSIINDYMDEAFTSEHDRFVHGMRTIQGSLIVSSFVNIILGYSRAWGELTRLFSPITVVLLVCLVGLGLFARGFPLLGNCVEIGLPMLILLVISQQVKFESNSFFLLLLLLHQRSLIRLRRLLLIIYGDIQTLPTPVSDPQKLPKWNYDGSSTGQASGEDSEVILYPQAIFKDPFRRGNILVMCDTYTPSGEPIPTNKRYNAAKIFSYPEVVAEEPWFVCLTYAIMINIEKGQATCL
ncbi:hypothetical protein CRYUN_Cryun13aG0077500 [Craigia yunnanensis]